MIFLFCVATKAQENGKINSKTAHSKNLVSCAQPATPALPKKALNIDSAPITQNRKGTFLKEMKGTKKRKEMERKTISIER